MHIPMFGINIEKKRKDRFNKIHKIIIKNMAWWDSNLEF